MGDPNGRGKELGDEATLAEWGVLESGVGWAIHQGCQKGCLELERMSLEDDRGNQGSQV